MKLYPYTVNQVNKSASASMKSVLDSRLRNHADISVIHTDRFTHLFIFSFYVAQELLVSQRQKQVLIHFNFAPIDPTKVKVKKDETNFLLHCHCQKLGTELSTVDVIVLYT